MAKKDDTEKYGEEVGWDNPDSAKELAKPAKLKGGNRTFRFYLPQPKDGEPTETYATFLTQEPVFIREHNVKIDGRYGNQFTCLSGSGEECPLCAAGDEPYAAWAFLVVDHSEWVDKKGTEHKDEVKLFVAKQRTAKELKTQHAKRKGLAGCMFQARRTDEFSPSVGDKFDFEIKVTAKQLKAGGVGVPIDDEKTRETGPFDIKSQTVYLQTIKDELAPKPVATLERAARGEKPSRDTDATAEIADEELDDIAF